MNSLYDQILSTLYSIWRHRWHGLATMWGVCLLGWAVVAYIPDEFEATARIFVEINEGPIRGNNAGADTTLRQIDRVKRTLISRPNLEKVIRRTDMDLRVSNESQMERLIDDLAKNIAIKSQGDDLFTLSFRADDNSLSDTERAQLAKKVVQSLVDLFIEEQSTRSSGNKKNEQIQFLDTQIADYERRLQEAESARKEFQLKNNLLPGMSTEQMIGTARAEFDGAEQRLIELRSARSVLAAQLNSIPQFIEGSMFNISGGERQQAQSDPGTTKGRIELLKRQISDAVSVRGWSDQHPDLVDWRRQISDLEKQYEIERKNTKPGMSDTPKMQNPLYVSTKNELIQKEAAIASNQARMSQMAGQLATLGNKAVTAPEIEAEQAKLNRNYDVLKQQQQSLLKDREELVTRLNADGALQPYEIKLVDPPVVPLKPVAPNRVVLLSAVLISGLLLGFGVAFVLSQLHTTFVSVNRLRETINMPVLGGVSSISSDQQRNQGRFWLALFGLAMGSLLIIYMVLLAFQIVQSNTAI